MRNIIVLNISMLVTMLATVASCALDEPTLGPADGKQPIQFVPGALPTKVLGSDDFNVAGHKMSVYDVFVSETDGGWTANYIDGVSIVSPDGTGVWPYEDTNLRFYWLQGVHKFFGYNNYDSKNSIAASDLFGADGVSYNKDNGHLSIAETTLTPTSPQFDFMYSDIQKRVITAASAGSDVSPVALECKHLFAAVSLSVENNLPYDDVIIKKVYFQKFKNHNSAVIDYSGDEVDVTYGSGSYDADHPFSTVDDITLVHGDKDRKSVVDVFNPSSGVKNYYLVWPQENLTPSQTPTISEDGQSNYSEDDQLIIIEYEIDGQQLKRAVAFPNAKDGHKAGNTYQYTISFTEKLIELKVYIRDSNNNLVTSWYDSYHELDYGDNSIAAAKLDNGQDYKLTVDPSTCDQVSSEPWTCYVKEGGKAVKFSFKLAAPKSGQWMVSLKGDFGAFEVSNPSGSVEDLAEFSVKPIVAKVDTPYSVQIHIAVRMPDGTVADADDVLQGTEVSSRYTVKF